MATRGKPNTNLFVAAAETKRGNAVRRCDSPTLSERGANSKWCDTPYTWNWVGTPFYHDGEKKYDKDAETVKMTPAELAALIQEIDQVGCKHIVFTGGEPLIQQAEIIKVLELLGEEYYIECETNGTLIPKPELASRVQQFNFSPKLENSGNEERLRNRPKVWAALVQLPQAIFKFVVSSDTDLVEIETLIAKYQVPRNRVYLMPEGRTREEIDARTGELVEICKQRGFNFSTRLHVIVWGALKGV